MYPYGREWIGKSVNGTYIELEKFGIEGKKILIIGGVHGHPERQSVDFCNALSIKLQEMRSPLYCRIFLISHLNPDSIHVEGKQTNANGIDLNRNFPSANQHLTDKEGKNKGGYALSEPESRIIFDLVMSEKPDLIITIHQLYACIDYDGPADDKLLDDLVNVFDMPKKKLGACNGSMGSLFGEEMSIPLITIEFENEMTNRRISETAERFAAYLSCQS